MFGGIADSLSGHTNNNNNNKQNSNKNLAVILCP